jgi:Protein of unknown function (DUF3891)
MLLREDERGWLAIGQPSHAWISGQLARAWGNERFGAVEPLAEVCLAAEHHDVGWAQRDLEPIYNPTTGLPRSFMEMPLDVHLGIFTDGPRSLVSQSRYAALLVSMHGHRLYARRNLDRASPEDAEAIRGFLAGQRGFQAELLATLGAEAAEVERASLLIWTWDYISLALCLGWSPATARGCPAAGAAVDLELVAGPDPRALKLDPWPFGPEPVRVRCEGRRLTGRSESEREMAAAFEQAAWETLELELVPTSASSTGP